MSAGELLDVIRYRVDGAPHIVVDAASCERCASRPCVRVCPASCFEWTGERLVFSYQTCLECGSCRAVCPLEAVQWNHPRGGFGVIYRST